MPEFILFFCTVLLIAHFGENRTDTRSGVLGETRYVVTDLGVLQDHQSSRAFGINNHGVAVGECTQNGFLQNAFLCEKNSTMKKVVSLGQSGIGQNVAVAVSNAEHIVGSYCDETGVSHGWILYSEKIHDLGTLGGNFCTPYAVNSSGVVVGTSFNTDYKNHAFVWSDGVMTDLFPSSNFSIATNINDAGDIVGFFENESFESIAFLRRANGEVVNLGSLGQTGFAFSNANGVNNRGQVVGASFSTTGYNHAFIFSDGKMRDLGTLRKARSSKNSGNNIANNSACDTTSEAFKINNHGVVIGESVSLGLRARPFVWSIKNGMQDLQKLLRNPATDFSKPANVSAQPFHLERVSDINDAGEIVGWGYWGELENDDDGSSHCHAVLLSPVSSQTSPQTLPSLSTKQLK